MCVRAACGARPALGSRLPPRASGDWVCGLVPGRVAGAGPAGRGHGRGVAVRGGRCISNSMAMSMSAWRARAAEPTYILLHQSPRRVCLCAQRSKEVSMHVPRWFAACLWPVCSWSCCRVALAGVYLLYANTPTRAVAPDARVRLRLPSAVSDVSRLGLERSLSRRV